MGRPSLLTDETARGFHAALRSGVPVEVAAAHVKVAAVTVREWLTIGRKARARADRGETLTDHEEACRTFADETEAVYAETHVLLAGRIVQASSKDWKSAAWMLQRRHPETWNLPERVEVSGPGGRPIEVAEVEARVLEVLTVEALEAPSGNGASEDR